MPHIKCYPIYDPNSTYFYCPSYAAAILFCCLFGTITAIHIAQAIMYKKPFATVLIMAGTWEFAGYIFRIFSIEQQLNSGLASAQILLILLAPLWINAFVYMVLARMIHFFLEDDRIFGVQARRISLLFVLCDIVSFLVQAGGGVLVTPSASPQLQQDGLHIYMGGVGLQILFIATFASIAIQFQRMIRRKEQIALTLDPETRFANLNAPSKARHLLHTVYAVLALIVFRNTYRLVEFSSGVESNITEHEWFAYVFDAVPMLTALVIFNIYHPGRILQGPNSDFSAENKARKEAKKKKKVEKRQAKDARREQMLYKRLENKSIKLERRQESIEGVFKFETV